MKRRPLLSAAFLTSVPFAGCLDNQNSVRLTARNFTDEAVEFELQMFSSEDELIYEHSSSFQAHQSYELPTLERSISYLETSVAGSTFSYTSSREFTPTLFDDPCDDRHLDFKVNTKHIDLDYLCSSQQL
jgi:hypothetical protein